MSVIAVSMWVDHPDQVSEAVGRASAALADGARMIEWRIDALGEEPGGLHAARRLVRESPAPCIVTCRPEWEGGHHAGTEPERQDLVRAVIEADVPPRYVDLELDAIRRDDEWLNVLGRRDETATSVILSSHDYETRPHDLIQRIEAMTNEPLCDVIKVAWPARSLRDNLEAFDLLRERRKPMIALCMGPFGLMSRVLAPKFGGLITYAGEGERELTAPGQPTVRELRDLHHFESIGRETKVYGVIGWPVEHSLSPRIHNAGFAETGHDGVYLPLPIPPEWEHFKATVGALVDQAGLDFRGASVTIPHKEHALRFVRERGGRSDALTQWVGAANTLIVGSAGGLECTNTDLPAAVEALCEGMSISPKELRGKRCALLGAGGVARAVAAGLADAGAAVVLFNRTPERAQQLAEDLSRFDAPGSVTAQPMDTIADGGFEIYVNCTSVGMAGGPAPDESPFPASVRLDNSATVMDTVYAPQLTTMLQQARSTGARTIDGAAMFMRQAALQFERWTGSRLPASPTTRTGSGLHPA